MSTGFHGKSIEEIVDLRVKEYEMRKAKEREDLEETRRRAEAKLAENKEDITKPKAEEPPKPANVSFIQKWKHRFHLD